MRRRSSGACGGGQVAHRGGHLHLSELLGGRGENEYDALDLAQSLLETLLGQELVLILALERQYVQEEPVPERSVVARLYVGLGRRQLADAVPVVDLALLVLGQLGEQVLGERVHLVVKGLQSESLVVVGDAHVGDPLDARHTVAVLVGGGEDAEAARAHRRDHGASVAYELIVADVEQAAVLGVVVGRLLAVHAHAEVVGARLDGAPYHELVARLVDVQQAGHARQRERAHKHGYLVVAVAQLAHLVRVLALAFRMLERVVHSYEPVDEHGHELTPLRQILYKHTTHTNTNTQKLVE